MASQWDEIEKQRNNVCRHTLLLNGEINWHVWLDYVNDSYLAKSWALVVPVVLCYSSCITKVHDSLSKLTIILEKVDFAKLGRQGF